MMKRLVLLTIGLFFWCCGVANATLSDRGNGLIYNDVLDIIWLSDADFANISDYITRGGPSPGCQTGQKTADVRFIHFLGMPHLLECRASGIGRTQRQILANLEEYFPRLEQSTLVDGRPRRMGQTSDGLAHVEIIGDPQDVDTASVMIGIPNNAPPMVIRNFAICLILIKNALPNWSGGVDWFTSAFERITDSADKTSEKTRVGNATVNMVFFKEFGMCTLTIKRNK